MSLRLLFAGVLWALPALAVSQSTLDAGAPDGAEQTAFVDRGFDDYDLPVSAFAPGHRSVQRIEGRIIWAAYRLASDTDSTANIVSGYRDRLMALGFEVLFECETKSCGGFDFRFGATVLPPPGMLIDVADFRQLSAQRQDPEAYASILVSRVLEDIYIQTVVVTPAAPTAEIAAAPAVTTDPDTVILPQEERALLEALRQDGHVPVSGLEFATGGTDLSGGSAAALDMLARMLSRDSELSVVIVGHSDNEGTLDGNINLSRQRAEAVRNALIRRGVPDGQLGARGIGYLAPVTSNATEEGRARNRRVELVLR